MIEMFQRLAMAIVKQAVLDYHKVLQTLKYSPHDRGALAEKDSLEVFFRSQWFSVLCDLDGEELITMIRTRRLRLEGER